MDTDSPAASPWTYDGESSFVGDSAVTLVDGTSFVVCGRSGDIHGDSVQGLFMLDTRVLSTWTLRIDGHRVQPLSVSTNGPFSATFVGRIVDPVSVDAPLSVVQRRYVGRGMREDLDIRNHGRRAAELRVELVLESDFASLFDVKGRGVPSVVGALSDVGDDTVEMTPIDGAAPRVVDATFVTTSVPPDEVTDHALVWNVVVDTGDRWSTCLLVGVTAEGRRLEPSYACGEPIENAIPVSRLRQWRDDVTTIDTDSQPLATALHRASEDLGALRIFDPDHPERLVVAAGAPWFMTLFGRDSLLTSWMALPLDHELAQGVLRELADAQGRAVNPATEEQPGRILHEVRFDPASSRLLGGSNTYYGTVDATPLFVMLVAELARWTGITPTITDLLPAADRALDWVDVYGDMDGDGFVEYLRSDPNGLENQGWKDSWDGIRHRDGGIADGPIALCEVQGYVYAALRGRAELGRALGEPAADTELLDARADELRRRFHDAFWIEDDGWYAIGLDGDKKQIGSLTSNLGHLLWTGIADEDAAPRLARHLTSPRMFTGWGLRTLSSDNPGYNPLSYHCGSVWPHDTAIAIAGLARYGFDREAHEIAGGLLAASTHTGGRLPELFAGFTRDDLPAPVPYPASCSPQAWAAASPLLLVRAMLGLEPDLLHRRVALRPRLPASISRIALRAMPLGNDRVTISASDDEVDAKGLDDATDVVIS